MNIRRVIKVSQCDANGFGTGRARAIVMTGPPNIFSDLRTIYNIRDKWVRHSSLGQCQYLVHSPATPKQLRFGAAKFKKKFKKIWLPLFTGKHDFSTGQTCKWSWCHEVQIVPPDWSSAGLSYLHSDKSPFGKFTSNLESPLVWLIGNSSRWQIFHRYITRNFKVENVHRELLAWVVAKMSLPKSDFNFASCSRIDSRFGFLAAILNPGQSGSAQSITNSDEIGTETKGKNTDSHDAEKEDKRNDEIKNGGSFSFHLLGGGKKVYVIGRRLKIRPVLFERDTLS